MTARPSCVVNVGGAEPADDSADFIIQAAYEDCAGFGTFMPGSTYGEEGAGAEGVYMVIVWLGIVVTIAVLVYWAVLGAQAPDGLDRREARRADHRPEGVAWMRRDRQIEFPPLQTHSRTFELVMLALSIICVIVVLVIVLATDIGNEFRPTV